MTELPRKANVKYTYGDYLTWPDDERWELIDGVPYNMTPAPSRRHQALSRELFWQIYSHIKTSGGPCKVYVAPFDVRLPKGEEADEDIDTVVQPDIVVVCDPAKLDDKGMRGAPDFVVEIASPHTIRRDMVEKLNLYERHGVKEYWLVLPGDKAVTIYRLGADGRYGKPDVYTADDEVPVEMLGGLTVRLSDVFAAE